MLASTHRLIHRLPDPQLQRDYPHDLRTTRSLGMGIPSMTPTDYTQTSLKQATLIKSSLTGIVSLCKTYSTA